MIKRFSLIGLISLVIFSGFCLSSLKTSSIGVPMAKAETLAMDHQGCEAQSTGTQMNCCINRPAQDTKSVQVAQNEHTYKKFFLVAKYAANSLAASSNPEHQIFKKCDKNYKSPPSLTGIVVKKE